MSARNSIIFALDRADTPVCLYFRDGGGDVAVAAQVGIVAADDDWDNESECTRLIVQNALNHLLDARQPSGGGISLVEPDEHDAAYLPVRICVPMMTVTIGDSQWMFEEYVALEPEFLRQACQA